MTTTDAGGGTGAEGRFGANLLSRYRPRTGVRHRTATSGRLIGAVGRASVGFGRAVGRSSQTRPVVQPGNLTSPALRPPDGWWTRVGRGADDVAPEPWANAPSWAEQLATTPKLPTARRAFESRPGPRDAAPKPTPSTPAEPPRPKDRLEALKQLLAARGERPLTVDEVRNRTRTEPGQPRPQLRPPAARRVDPEQLAAEVAAERSATPAGPSTSPGAIARRAVPETVTPPTESIAGLAPHAPTPGGPAAAPTARAATEAEQLAALRAIVAQRTAGDASRRGPDDSGGQPARRASRTPQPRPWPGADRPPSTPAARRTDAPLPSVVTRPAVPGRSPSAPEPGRGPAAQAAIPDGEAPDPVPADEQASGQPSDLRLHRLINRTRPHRPLRGRTPRLDQARPAWRADERGATAGPAELVATAAIAPDARAAGLVRRSLADVVADLPALPRVGGFPDDAPADRAGRDAAATPSELAEVARPVRRVTLPRAMSRQHRPPTVLRRATTAPDAAVAPEPGPAAPPAARRTTEVSPADATAPTTADRVVAPAEPRTVPGSATEATRTTRPAEPTAAPAAPATASGDPSAPVGAAPATELVSRFPAEWGSPAPDGPTPRTREGRLPTSAAIEPAPTPDAPGPVTPTAGLVGLASRGTRGEHDAPPAARQPARPASTTSERASRFPARPTRRGDSASGTSDLGPAEPASPGGSPDAAIAVTRQLARATAEPSAAPEPTQYGTPGVIPGALLRRALRPLTPAEGPSSADDASTAAAPADPRPATPGAPAVHAPATPTPPVVRRMRPDAAAARGAVAGVADQAAPERQAPFATEPGVADVHARELVAPPALARSAAGEQLAARFLDELSRSTRQAPTPLPVVYRPMAEAIAGRRPVVLSTDHASRRALRRVGKRAATTGTTIHLDASPTELATPAPRLNEIIAHELTHVAHASPAPRFFDDVDESPEERRAEAVARVIARSPLAPMAAAVAAPTLVRRSPGAHPTEVVRRMPSSSPSSGSSSPGSISAADLAASITGQPSDQVVRRQHVVAAPAPTPAAAAPAPAAAAPAAATPAAPAAPAASSPTGGSPADRDAEFRAMLERNLDVVLRRIEDHILIDIERRGGRAWRGF